METLPPTIYYISNSKVQSSSTYEKKREYGKDWYFIWKNQKEKQDKYYLYSSILESNCFFDIQEAISENVKQIQEKIKSYEKKLEKLNKILKEHTELIKMPF